MGMAPATINRELSTLIRMLGLGYEREKVARMPKIHKLTEAPPRSGFFESHDFEAVCQQLRPELQLAARIAYNFEWRMPSEVLSLTLSQVDLSAGTLRLNPGGSKTGEARTVYLTREIAALLEAQVERVRTLSRQRGAVLPFLFVHFAWPIPRAAHPRLSEKLDECLSRGGAHGHVAPRSQTDGGAKHDPIGCARSRGHAHHRTQDARRL